MMVQQVYRALQALLDQKEKEDTPVQRVPTVLKVLLETKVHQVYPARAVLAIKEMLDHLVNLELMDLLEHQ